MEYATLKGKKLNMSQIFLPTGKVVPVTVVELESADALANADNFMNKDVVVTGKSKGKGFTGAIKRWGFRKQGETRGAKDKVRGPGAIGSQTPGRVFKGKKMAGHKGNVQVTIKGLKIVNVDSDSGCLMVSGPIPGARNSPVTLKIEGISLSGPISESEIGKDSAEEIEEKELVVETEREENEEKIGEEKSEEEKIENSVESESTGGVVEKAEENKSEVENLQEEKESEVEKDEEDSEETEKKE
jgi:hypothetical protein